MKETIIRQYRKKPVVIEAVQLDNINVPCVVRWIGEDKAKMELESDEAWTLGKAPPIFSVTICTLEGDMKAMPGDYIIKGVGGEFYPCKPDIFEKTYEAVEPPKEENKMINEVTVRWHDGYLEEFKATEVRFGSDLLWMRLEDGKNRHIPLRSVRWFGMSQESHQAELTKEEA